MAHEKEKKKHKHSFKSTHVTHHNDGSATVRHEHEDGVNHVEHAVADLDGVHDSLEQHLGAPNPGEEQAEAGQATAAPSPMGAAAPTAV